MADTYDLSTLYVSAHIPAVEADMYIGGVLFGSTTILVAETVGGGALMMCGALRGG